MNLISPLYIIMILLIETCSPAKNPNDIPPKEELIFQSGFENDSRVIPRGSDADIIGTDRSYPDRNDWVKDLDGNRNIGNFSLQYQGGDSTMRYAKIIEEPGNPSNHLLQFWLDKPNVEGSKGRIQGNIYGNNGIYEFYQSERMFLTSDFNAVKTFPKKITWLTIAEFWNNITWNQDVPYRFRITLGIGKPEVTESDLHFIINAQDCELYIDGRQKYTTLWSEINEDFDVPIGKWFTLEYYYKEGDDKNGRFYMAITPEGEAKKVIFDLTRITHNSTDPTPDGIGDFNPIKLYTSKELIDFMRSKGKTLQIYWDDFRLWKDKKPG